MTLPEIEKALQEIRASQKIDHDELQTMKSIAADLLNIAATHQNAIIRLQTLVENYIRAIGNGGSKQ